MNKPINMRLFDNEALPIPNGNILSASDVIAFMDCPWKYRMKELGEVEPANSNDLIDFAAHNRILVGRHCPEYQALLSDANQSPHLTPEQVDIVERMSTAVAENNEAVDLLLYGRAYAAATATIENTKCPIKIDFIHPCRGIVEIEIVDDLKWFEAEVRRRHLVHRAAYNQLVVNTLHGEIVPVHFIVVERSILPICGVWCVGVGAMSTARAEVRAAIRRLQKAWENDDFPTGYEKIRTLGVL